MKNNTVSKVAVSVGRIVFLSFLVLFFFYLSLPAPKIAPLPDAVRSSLEGDTWQIEGIQAFFTDRSREDITAYYGKQFSRSSFLFLPIPTMKLNHPPEYAQIAISDQTKSNYLEEYIHPFRESLIVSGWEPLNYPYRQRLVVPPEKHEYKGREFNSKVTVLYRETPVLFRLFFSALSFAGLYLVISHMQTIRKQKWLKK